MMPAGVGIAFQPHPGSAGGFRVPPYDLPAAPAGRSPRSVPPQRARRDQEEARRARQIAGRRLHDVAKGPQDEQGDPLGPEP